MKEKKIIEPKQKRSIEKKNRIIEYGMQTMLTRGYHHTTTDDIAKAAGISTGIIYHYFEDKNAILLAGIEMYFQQITENIYGILEQTSLNDMETFLNNVLDYFLAIHKNNITAHNELESLQLTDPKVGALYQNIKEEVLTKVTRLFEDKLSNASHAKEKILISYQLMEDFCHFSISNSAGEMDIDYMKKVIIRSVMDILKN